MTNKLHSKYFILIVLFFLAYWYSMPVWSADSGKNEMEWAFMFMKLLGGLALFLFGMEQMADALKAVAGDKMKNILQSLTSNRFMGAFTGAFVTAVIQSSSVTTVLVVGFISAGLMNMSQSVGVIMGANIGTTITAQIVAFKVTKAALLLIAVGYGMNFLSSKDKIKHYGAIIMGLGMIFFGMGVMSDAMKPLRDYQPFLDLMISMESPFVGILVAAAFTALVQSSSATTGIVIVMASQGFITLPAGIALAFGSNIGTCVTALLASIGKPREAIRAASVHVLFNVLGVVIWFAFIPELADFVRWFSPQSTELSGIDKLAAEAPRQIANAHTIFNIANTFIFIWFTTQIAAIIEKLIPDTDLKEEGLDIRAKYLDDELLSTPALALDRVRLEILHMGEFVNDMLGKVMPAIIKGDKEAIKSVAKIDDEIDLLYEQIVNYLGKISRKSLSESQTEELMGLMDAVGELENIGDTIETNLVSLGLRRLDAGFSISPATSKMLYDFHHQVQKSVSGAIHAVAQKNEVAARAVIEMKSLINEQAESASLHQAQRLIAEEPNRILAYTIEVDIVEKQKRIYYFAKRMAKTVLLSEELLSEPIKSLDDKKID